jgi:hypothetical protein
MPANDSYEFDYPPGYVKPTHEYGQPYGDEFHAEAVQELLLSAVGYTQRGVTLAGGQGVLPTGTVIARHTGSGKYFSYNPTATDGRQIALGVLRDARDTGGNGYASLSAYNSGNGEGITLVGGSVVFPASPAAKAQGDALGNLVYRGILNANLVSGTDIVNLVSYTGGGIGNLGTASGAYSAGALVQLGARVVPFGGSGAAFPGGPMDGQPGNVGGTTSQGVSAFIF